MNLKKKNKHQEGPAATPAPPGSGPGWKMSDNSSAPQNQLKQLLLENYVVFFLPYHFRHFVVIFHSINFFLLTKKQIKSNSRFPSI